METGEEENGLARWANEELPLFGVAGLRRVRGGAHSSLGSRSRREGEEPLFAVMTQGVELRSEDGASISVTSHREDDEHRYETVRGWAPINPYRESRRGRHAAVADEQELDLLEWSEVTLVVDDEATGFETADLGEGVWVAVGRVPGAIISIESHGVALTAVRLQRVTDDLIPPPPRPDLGHNGQAALDALDERFEIVPFQRIHRWADFWALRQVEEEHVARLSREHHLTADEAATLWRYWEERIEAHLSTTLDRLSREHEVQMGTLRTPRGCVGPRTFDRLWFNTFGPGGRTWIGNRYATVRRHTFRRRWRP